MKVNYFGEVVILNKVNDDLWVSDADSEDVCLVFQRFDGVWDRGYYTLDEIEAFQGVGYTPILLLKREC